MQEKIIFRLMLTLQYCTFSQGVHSEALYNVALSTTEPAPRCSSDLFTECVASFVLFMKLVLPAVWD